MKYFLIYLSISALVLTYCNNEVERLNSAIEFKEKPIALNSEKIEQEIKRFLGKGYEIDLPKGWTSKNINENQVLFTGPKIGNANAALYITSVTKGDKGYLLAAEKTKKQQSVYENYIVVEEKDISQPNFKAYMRRAHWFEKDINMELFVREIFTESDKYVFIISASIPNTPNINILDKAMVAIMNSFRFD